MSWPTCPRCAFPDVPVADRAIERLADVAAATDTETGCTAVAVGNTLIVHRSYRCAGCLTTFWTAEHVGTVDAKSVKVRHLYVNGLT